MSAAARSRAARLAVGIAAACLCAGFLALGTWQIQRRAWKLDLIARVDSRVHAAPAAAPGRAEWGGLSAARDEYRHVRLGGRYLNGRTTFVQAATELGSGYWELTPLQTDDGSLVLVNRGFVAADALAATRAEQAHEHATASVTGLLRLSEPGGNFLRRNDPAAERWRTRDIAAIAAARGLHDVAPYFVDADADTGVPGEPGGSVPIGGLTVVSFRNNHLEYALTWFALAAGTAVAAVVFFRAGAHGPDPATTPFEP